MAEVEAEETMVINRISINETNLKKEEEDEVVIRQSQQTRQMWNAIGVTSMVITNQNADQICQMHMVKHPILQKRRESKLEKFHCLWLVMKGCQPARTCGI